MKVIKANSNYEVSIFGAIIKMTGKTLAIILRTHKNSVVYKEL